MNIVFHQPTSKIIVENKKNKQIITLNHAPVAERQIRTIKDMIHKRVENKGKPWTESLFQVL